MERDEVEELFYITHIDNLSSIMEHGILCHEEAIKFHHVTIDKRAVQEIRDTKCPRGRSLHEYVNLFFNPRNKMLFRVISINNIEKICVLSVSHEVIDLPGVLVSDRNAASDWAMIDSTAKGLRWVDRDKVFIRYWNDPDDRLNSIILGKITCAEVLCPEKVKPSNITGIIVTNQAAKQAVLQLHLGIPVSINRDMFFKKG